MSQRTKLPFITQLGVQRVQWDHVMTQDAITALAQELARQRLKAATSIGIDTSADPVEPVAAAIGALTDSTGGTADTDYDLAAVVTPTIGIVDGVTAFSPKAGFDTAVSAINNAHFELADRVNEMLHAILGFDNDGPVYITGMSGTSPDGTIGAITSALTAATSGCVEAAGGIREINKMRNYQSTLVAAINFLRVAIGLEPLQDGVGGFVASDEERLGWDVDDLNGSSTGTAATSGQQTLTDATVDAALGAVRNNISTLALALNDMRGDLGFGMGVVATSAPSTRRIFAYQD
jgi:hypothetical protein